MRKIFLLKIKIKANKGTKGETNSRNDFRKFRSPSNSMEFQGILTEFPWNNVTLRNSVEKELIGIPLLKEFYGISGI